MRRARLEGAALGVSDGSNARIGAMSYAAQTARYLEAEVMSRPREWLVPLMYEHLLAALHRASLQIQNNDIEGKSTSLAKATTILVELASAIDHDKGGEVARGLSSLYSFFLGELLDVGRTLDTRRLARIISSVSDLHEGWVQAAEAVAPRGRADTPTLTGA